eukprot:m.245410 g.245410  ORF g.245410 m.245410 type:complete len:429 (+) comp14702_c0_seq1:27-1313(+)
MALRRWLGAASFAAMGLGCWHLPNSIWAQLPGMIPVQPEGKAIATQINLAIQGGNVFVLLYAYFKDRIPLNWGILSILMLTCACTYTLAFTWDRTINSHSVPILLLSFAGGSVGVVSNVLNWAFASKYLPMYSVALSVGSSASPIIACMLALGQDIGGDTHRFSLSTFFIIAAFIITACLLLASFLLITSAFEHGKRPSVSSMKPPLLYGTDGDAGTRRSIDPVSAEESHGHDERAPLLSETPKEPLTAEQKRWFHARVVVFVVISIWMFGVFPGCSPYMTTTGTQLLIFQIAGYGASIFASLFAGLSIFRDTEIFFACVIMAVGIAGILIVALIEDPPSYIGTYITPALNGTLGFSYVLIITVAYIQVPRHVLCHSCRIEQTASESDTACEPCQARGQWHVHLLATIGTVAAALGSITTFVIVNFIV